MRATLLSKSRVYWSAGCLFSCVLGWVFLKDNSWRSLLFVICLPGIYALVEHILDGRESLRYLWVQQRGEEVLAMVNSMCLLNQRPTVTKEYVLSLMEDDRGRK